MAASKKKKIKQSVESKEKRINQGGQPVDKRIAFGADPEQYYSQKPVWAFFSADQDKWAFNGEHLGDTIWTEVIPRLKAWESQTWRDILLIDKTNNHSIDVENLNKEAQKRLAERYIEEEALISLRLSGTHRLYGYMTGNVFNILWYDDTHGDNSYCVCRSHKKHT